MNNLVSIVIPIYKSHISKLEQISLVQAIRTLKSYSIAVIHPIGLNITEVIHLFTANDVPFISKAYHPRYFADINGYNKLLTSKNFYKSFSEKKYILIYQNDAFVFSDQLDYWCNQNYDYIGAPWMMGYGNAEKNAPYIGVGNGGLSLRKVSAHLRVLSSFANIRSTREYWSHYEKLSVAQKLKHFPSNAFGFFFKNNFHHWFNGFNENEDDFWGNYANRRFSWFNVAPVDVALKFSMEVHPSRMYADNNYELPFGCHAWWKHDLNFWKPHIEKFGYEI